MKHSDLIHEVIDSLVLARKSKSLSQSELGRRLGVPQSYISRLEGGRSDIRLSSLIELARFLGLEVLLVPKALAPTVISLTGSQNRSNANVPLYSLDDDSIEG
jgi:transcriptional regulator with XRE-family HTH domain